MFVETDAAKIYTTVLDGLMDSVGEPLYPGDERRIFADALVSVLVAVYNEFNDSMKQRTLQYARGAVLDAIAERYDIKRLEPSRATATFRFSMASSRTENQVIPKGTKVTVDGTVYFETDDVAVIVAGNRYVDVTATCTEGGSAHNGYPVGSINTMVDLNAYVTMVSNTTTTSGGDDGEPYDDAGDERLRERIRLAPATLSTAGPESGYRFFAMSADPNIADVSIDSPSANTVNIYALMSGGQLPDADTLAKILAVCNAEDVRPMTDVVTALAPEVVKYDIELKYYCTKRNEADTVKAVEGDGGAIDRYNEWQTTALGRDINPDQLRRLILCPDFAPTLVGADRVDIEKPTFIDLDKGQVAQFSGNLTVTHEVTT